MLKAFFKKCEFKDFWANKDHHPACACTKLSISYEYYLAWSKSGHNNKKCAHSMKLLCDELRKINWEFEVNNAQDFWKLFECELIRIVDKIYTIANWFIDKT